LDDAQSSLAREKLTLEPKDPNKVFDEYYLLEVFLRLIRNYVLFWATISKGGFAESWSNLQDVQDDLRILKRFLTNPLPKLLVYLEEQCGQLEQLYPYKVFFSIGCIAKTLECSICSKRIDSFDCVHIMGELYRGQIAHGSVGEIIELDHVSMVPNPQDKRCTIQLLDSSPQFQAVAFLRDCLRKGQLTPLGLGRVNRSKRLVPSGELNTKGEHYAFLTGLPYWLKVWPWEACRRLVVLSGRKNQVMLPYQSRTQMLYVPAEARENLRNAASQKDQLKLITSN
jgi:hypothetical protein